MLVLLPLWTSGFPSPPRFPFPLGYREPPEALFLPQSCEKFFPIFFSPLWFSYKNKIRPAARFYANEKTLFRSAQSEYELARPLVTHL
jgi:hypothetical protein